MKKVIKSFPRLPLEIFVWFNDFHKIYFFSYFTSVFPGRQSAQVVTQSTRHVLLLAGLSSSISSGCAIAANIELSKEKFCTGKPAHFATLLFSCCCSYLSSMLISSPAKQIGFIQTMYASLISKLPGFLNNLLIEVSLNYSFLLIDLDAKFCSTIFVS